MATGPTASNYTLPPADPCTLVIFGASGDLTKRLLIPALYNLSQQRLLPDRFAVLGFARSEGNPERWRGLFRESIAEAEVRRSTRRLSSASLPDSTTSARISTTRRGGTGSWRRSRASLMATRSSIWPPPRNNS